MLIAAQDAPRHETPNAVMRTLAAPSLGASDLSVWEVAMRAGQRGPSHEVDSEQVWTILAGEMCFEVAGESITARAGDALCLPAGARRQVAAINDAHAVVASLAAPSVTTPDGGTRPLPWAA